MDNTDDEALNWAGDDARQRGGGTWSVPKRREGASLSPSRSSSAGEAPRGSSDGDGGFDTSTASTTQPADGTQPATVADSAALVATGVFAGIYLLFTVAWLITAFRDPVHFGDALAEAMFIGGLWAAVLAGPAVFVATLVFTEKRPRTIRFLLLIAGALILVPWPYFTWAG
jgi:hypothetical protein